MSTHRNELRKPSQGTGRVGSALNELSKLRPREVVWVDWLCAKGEKVFIRVAGQGVKGLSPGEDLTTEELRVAVRRGVGGKDLVGERGDNAVAVAGGLFIRAVDGNGKGRQQKQPTFLQWLAELRRYSLRQAARGADNDRVRAPQQDGQALPLHRRMKSADDRHSRTAKFVRQVIGLNDQSARTTDGAE